VTPCRCATNPDPKPPSPIYTSVKSRSELAEERYYRFRSSCGGCGLRATEPKLLANILRQLLGRSILRGREASDDGDMPRSRSSSLSYGIGKADDEDSLTVSAA